MVGHFPLTGRDPYVVLLTHALLNVGWGIARDVRLAPGWLWANRKKVRVLHFHWPSLYYETGRATTFRLGRTLLMLRFVLLLWMARRLGYRLVWTAHNLLPHGPHRRLYRLERWIACRWLWHGVIAHCPATLDSLRTRFHFLGAGRVLPHPSFSGYFPVGRGRQAMRTELSISPDCHVFLCFGNIRPYKGIDTLLDACRLLVARQLDTDWRVLIVGNGPPEVVSPLMRRARGLHQVRWLDRWIPDEQVADYVQASDSMVLPYRRVTTSGNAMLAVTYRKPVVLPDLGCLRTMMASGAGVVYAPDGGATALAEAMERVQRLDSERVAQACEKADRHWTWEMAGRGSAEFYDLI